MWGRGHNTPHPPQQALEAECELMLYSSHTNQNELEQQKVQSALGEPLNKCISAPVQISRLPYPSLKPDFQSKNVLARITA
ncbi:hypothetical protein RRG08_050788 [Elysia crispata]|uniref:Uncharacterized protein n=1 Tax=Elysia crispata TaxID=231223 RepID=A0AAE1CY72_9GAST|nr:hypothetical protein RRG08_050788 [Elysia crispata]